MAEPMTKDSLIVRWRPPSRLFLYGLQATGPLGEIYSAAAIGLLYSDVLDIAHVYPPGTFDICESPSTRMPPIM